MEVSQDLLGDLACKKSLSTSMTDPKSALTETGGVSIRSLSTHKPRNLLHQPQILAHLKPLIESINIPQIAPGNNHPIRNLPYAPSNFPRASMSCCTSRSPPDRLRYTISSSEYDSDDFDPALNGTYFAVKPFAAAG
ncbi:hypothetical protein CR513_07192, partial [Mucuna pruriens]